MKNIITMAWAVIILLYNWLSAINWTPGPDSSNLINTENAVPTKPANRAKIRYKVPISFAFEEKNHLSNHKDMSLLFVYILFLVLFLISWVDKFESSVKQTLTDSVCQLLGMGYWK